MRRPVTVAVADSLGTRNVRMTSLVPCGSDSGLTVTCAAATPDQTTRTTSAPAAVAAHRSTAARARATFAVLTRGFILPSYRTCRLLLLHRVVEADLGLAEVRDLDLQDDLPVADDGRVRAVGQHEAPDAGLVHVRLDRPDVLVGLDEVERDALSHVGRLSARTGELHRPVVHQRLVRRDVQHDVAAVER